MTAPLPSLDIGTLTEAYRTGKTDPETVLRAIFAAIEQQGKAPVWISVETLEGALARLARAPKGPLWGIPFAVKDNIDVAGFETTCACPDFAYRPERSAEVVARLEAAGAIVIGKTNLDQFATGLNGTRSPYGAPHSVFSAEHISGGSSSGSAVAVASGLVSFALGTDTAGSGRVPAAFNNICGLKPTKGLLSTQGLVPACRSQDVISIFALTAHDAVSVLRHVEGVDPADPFSRTATQRPTPKTWRLGIPKTLEFFGDRNTEALYRQTAARAQSLGATLIPFDLEPFLATARLLYSGPWVAERLAAIEDFAAAKPASIIEPVRSIILGARTLSAADTFKGLYELQRLRRLTEPTWQAIDAMLLPTAGTTYRIDEMLADPVTLNSNLGHYTNFVNLLDLAAFALPAGFRSDGLPAGVTLVGEAFTDLALAELAACLHASCGEIPLGATATNVLATPALTPRVRQPDDLLVAVVGAHLTGQPLNWQLTERNATFVETTRTARGYSLYSLPDTTPPKPGLVFDGRGAGLIEVELWRMPMAAFGSFVGLIPAPLGIGTLTLEDGRTVKGFICEQHAVQSALDITSYQGWRNWLSDVARR